MAEQIAGNGILVGIDGSEANRPAVSWAIRECAARGNRLIAVDAWHVPAFAYAAPGYAPITEDWTSDEISKMIDSTISELDGDRPISVEQRIVEGSAYDILLGAAREPDVGLVVVGSRGHGALAGMLLGSVSHSLSHHCPKPLVIVPHRMEASDLEAPMREVVVGVDGSEGADRALRWAAAEAKLYGARLLVVSAWHSERDKWFDAQRAAGDLITTALNRLDPHGVDVEVAEHEGAASDVLLDAARSADLLVVGTRRLGRTKEVLLGSTSHQCTHHSTVPVAVIPAS